MTSLLRRTLLCACLGALAVPATAAAGAVTPPGSGDEGSLSAAAARTAANPGCEAKNVIAFRQVGTDVDPRYRVRHSGRIRCTQVKVRIGCVANLLRGDQQISHEDDRGRNRCRIGTPFSESRLYREGTQFTQNYRYKLTLKNRRKHWSGTTRKCPRRKNDRRTLICKASHTTEAPKRSVDRISS